MLLAITVLLLFSTLGSCRYGFQVRSPPRVLVRPPPAGIFKTEPHIRLEEFFNTSLPQDKGLLADGFIFLDAMYPVPARGGPQIYDLHGTLIWQGDNQNTSMNLYVCDYLDESLSHLCFHRNTGVGRMTQIAKSYPADLEVPNFFPTPTLNYGQNIVLDNTYTPVGRNFTSLLDGLPINGHVFQMLPGGQTFLGLSDEPLIMDLQPYGFPSHQPGWVNNQCISETNVLTGETIFQWCYIESGLPLWETQTFFLSHNPVNRTEFKVGSGSYRSPWDFLHLNSVDKSSEGDYYVSFRHGDQIIKVAGLNSSSPGKVLWRMGGRSNDFEFIDFPFPVPFSRQHDIRFMSSSGPEEVLSLFNNAWDGEGPKSQPFSEGQVIRVNTEKMTARLERRYIHPTGGLSGGRGNLQHLPNGNVFVGWGVLPEMTEFDKNGTVLYHTKFTGNDKAYEEVSYRAYKFPWKGLPGGTPAILAYSRGCGSKVVAYVSWNGATEVRQWRFWRARDPRGPWIPAGTFPKDGFETNVTLTNSWWYGTFVSVEALDSSGRVLGLATNQTYVPAKNITALCDEQYCPSAARFFVSGNFEALTCGITKQLVVVIIIGLFFSLEMTSHASAILIYGLLPWIK